MRFIQNLLASWKAFSPRTHLLLAAGALVILAAFAALLYFRPAVAPVERETFEAPTLPVSVTSSFEEGIHYIEGTVTLRNRCQRLDTVASLDETGGAPVIRVDITSDHDEGICLEIADTRSFELEVEGPESARIEIYVNGLPEGGGDAF